MLGFVREAVLAGYFGVSAEYDAFIVAQIIPHFLLSMLGEASMGAAVVPVYLSFIAPRDPSERRRILGSGYLLISLLFSAVAAVCMVFAPQLSRLFAPGFTASQIELTALLTRVMMPSLIFLGLSNFLVGLLHSVRSFGPAALTGVVFNLSVVLSTAALAGRFGIIAPAVGILVGTVIQLAIMMPSMVKEGLFPAVGTSFTDPALIRMWRLFWPILAGGLVVAGLQVGDKVIGSLLAEGSLSALSFADRIAGGPSRIFTMALAVVLFPELVRRIKENSSEQGSLVVKGVTIGAFLTLPWMGIFIALREPIVAVLLERGAFDSSDTALVAAALAVYCLGQFAMGISTLVNNSFYSHHDSRVPTLIYIATYVVRLGLILALVPFFGYLAIPGGEVIAINVELAVLLWVLKKRHMPSLDLRQLLRGLIIIIAASVIGYGAAAGVQMLTADLLPRTSVGLLGGIGVASVVAILTFHLSARLMGSGEAIEVERRTRQVMRRVIARAWGGPDGR